MPKRKERKRNTSRVSFPVIALLLCKNNTVLRTGLHYLAEVLLLPEGDDVAITVLPFIGNANCKFRFLRGLADFGDGTRRRRCKSKDAPTYMNGCVRIEINLDAFSFLSSSQHRSAICFLLVLFTKNVRCAFVTMGRQTNVE
jgi:hypothetical protein